MRTFLATALLFCLLIGLYLLVFGPVFEMPDRARPGCGWLVTAPVSRLIGVGLLALAVAGWRVQRSAWQDNLLRQPRWALYLHFALTSGALLIFMLASALAPYGPLALTAQAPAAQAACLPPLTTTAPLPDRQ